MLLETLDIKQNDIIIFSKNKFDLKNNFKIIYKDDKDKKIHPVNYSDVCRFVNEYTPKNMIIYRVLTNIPDFEIDLSRYGFFLSINNETELVFFDPVFAVKELEEFSERINFKDLRFRVQQVGLTTLNRRRTAANYAEIYSVDLHAEEAKNQHDEVFVEALFVSQGWVNNMKEDVKDLTKKEAKVETPAVVEKKLKETKKEEKAEELKKIIYKTPVDEEHIETPKDEIKFIKHDLSEDKGFDYRELMKLNSATRERRGEKIGKPDKTGNKAQAIDRQDRIPEKQKEGEAPKVKPVESTKVIEFQPDEKPEDTKKLQIEPGPGPQIKPQKVSFSELLNKTKAEHGSKKTGKEPEQEKIPLIEIFKSSSSLEKYLEGKVNKQIVLKLKQRN